MCFIKKFKENKQVGGIRFPDIKKLKLKLLLLKKEMKVYLNYFPLPRLMSFIQKDAIYTS